MQRVVITGIGCVGPLGLDAPTTWQAMQQGQCGIRPIRGFDGAGLKTPVAAQLQGYDASALFAAKQLVLLDPVSQYALTRHSRRPRYWRRR
jgi:nodulation protein E